jgi:hypothetical protein
LNEPSEIPVWKDVSRRVTDWPEVGLECEDIPTDTFTRTTATEVANSMLQHIYIYSLQRSSLKFISISLHMNDGAKAELDLTYRVITKPLHYSKC